MWHVYNLISVVSRACTYLPIDPFWLCLASGQGSARQPLYELLRGLSVNVHNQSFPKAENPIREITSAPWPSERSPRPRRRERPTRSASA